MYVLHWGLEDSGAKVGVRVELAGLDRLLEGQVQGLVLAHHRLNVHHRQAFFKTQSCCAIARLSEYVSAGVGESRPQKALVDCDGLLDGLGRVHRHYGHGRHRLNVHHR